MSNRTFWGNLWVHICRWLAWRLPRALVYQCALRVGDYTTRSENDWERLNLNTALGLWNWPQGAIDNYYAVPQKSEGPQP